jgi:hypothetical protein
MPSRKSAPPRATTTPSPRRRRPARSRPLKARRSASASSTSPPPRASTPRPSTAASSRTSICLKPPAAASPFYDYDNDGWLDLFLVNGWRLEGFPKGQEPHCRLFKNNRDGTFTDVTIGSGLEHKTGWGQACCVGDYNNDGNDDLFVTTTARTPSTATTATAPSPMSLEKDWPSPAEDSLEHRLHLRRLRPRRPSRSLRRQLRRLRPQDRAAPRRRPLHLQRHPRRLRPSRTGGRQEHSLSQQRRRHLRRCQREVRHVDCRRHLRPQRRRIRSRQRWLARHLRRQRLRPRHALSESEGRHLRDIAIEAGAALSAEAKPQAGMGVSIGDYQPRRQVRHRQDQLRRRHRLALHQPRRRQL